MKKNNLSIEREKLAFTMSRIFDAPRELVWEIVIDPNQVPKWWGPGYATTIVDRMDVRIGGSWRFIQKEPEGNEYAFSGVYREVTPPERLVYTFEFEPMAGHAATETITFRELPDHKTEMTSETAFNSLEDLEGMLQTGMEGGAEDSWDRLEELLMIAQREK